MNVICINCRSINIFFFIEMLLYFLILVKIILLKILHDLCLCRICPGTNSMQIPCFFMHGLIITLILSECICVSSVCKNMFLIFVNYLILIFFYNVITWNDFFYILILMNSISLKFINSIIGSHLCMFNVPFLIGWFLICEHVAIVKKISDGFNYNEK